MPRTRTPTAIKKLAGNPGKRAINKKEPQPKGDPNKPTLSALASKVWDRLTKAMPLGVYTAADTGLLAAYCEAVANHQEASQCLANEPKMVKGSMGQMVPSPWFRIQSDAASKIVTLGARLGLDPISRQQINAEGEASDDEGFNIH
jgi:P27 family predicted phage terminase small subunit